MQDFICKFCNKGFGSEKTISRHLCLKKKRWAEKDTLGARLGFRVFQRFFEMNSPKYKTVKTQEEFVQSNYYASFVSFGRYLVELDPVSTDRFVDFVIKNGVKIADWCKEYVYVAYLDEFIKSESPESAVERTILEMQEWAKENGDVFNNYFRAVSPNEATFKIRAGRISPWVLYLSESGGSLLDRMSPEQGKIVNAVIDPGSWQIKFMLYKDSVNFVQTLLSDAGI